MQKTEINVEWMNELMNDGKKQSNDQQYSKIDWILNGRAFRKELKFKLLPANSKENGIFSYVVGTHWLDSSDGRKRFVCPEQTQHLKKLGQVCPICEAKRKLLAMGFKEEELTTPGKFGPVPLFDPKLTSNVKVVGISSDLKNDWDQSHISILQQNGSFLTKWMVQKYIDKETPELLNLEHSNLIRFSRQSDNSKFEREISFACFDPSPDVLAKLREENEALTLPDLWKMPTDDEMLYFRQLAAEMKQKFIDARNALKQVVAETLDNQASMNQPQSNNGYQQQQQQPVNQFAPQYGNQAQTQNTQSWNMPRYADVDNIPF